MYNQMNPNRSKPIPFIPKQIIRFSYKFLFGRIIPIPLNNILEDYDRNDTNHLECIMIVTSILQDEWLDTQLKCVHNQKLKKICPLPTPSQSPAHPMPVWRLSMPLRRPSDACPTPIWCLSDACPMPIWLLLNALPTPIRHPSNNCPTPIQDPSEIVLRYDWDLSEIWLW